MVGDDDMSRVGKNPIDIPEGVEVKINGQEISVKGPRGELKWRYPEGMKVTVQEKKILVERPSDAKLYRSLHGTTRSIIANMVEGTSRGFKKVIQIVGTGYRAQVQGQKILFTLGYSHPVEFPLPEGIKAQVDNRQVELTIEGIDKQLVGQVAANIRSLRPPDAYKGKGVRYSDETIRLKEGKKGK